MRKLLLALLLATAAQAEEIRIGAWNIEWLGRPDMRSGPSANVNQTPDDVSAYIEASGVDVLSLEEICVEADHQNSTLRTALARLSQRTGNRWKHVLFPKKGGEATQWTGLAWNTARVQAVGEPFKLPVRNVSSDGFNLWKRHPQGMQFSAGPGKTDFVLVPLHLKSNRRDDPGDNPAKQRGQECQALVEILPLVRQHFSDQDVVLLGDTNVMNSAEPAIRSLVTAGQRNLNATDLPTTWKGPDPFDRIFPPVRQPEFAHSQLRIFKPAGFSPTQFKVRLSDHYMVTIQVRVGSDDD